MNTAFTYILIDIELAPVTFNSKIQREFTSRETKGKRDQQSIPGLNPNYGKIIRK